MIFLKSKGVLPFLAALLVSLVAAPTTVLAAVPRGTPDQGSIITYPIPAGVANAASFEVKVRSPGGRWKELGTYKPSLVELNVTTGSAKTYSSSMAYFDFNGTVEVSAKYLNGPVENARVRPNSYGITPKRSGRTVKFTLDKPRDVVLQVSDDVFDVLHLFTNAPPVDVPSADDPDVIYFGPGFHDVKENINVASGKTVYVAGGAVVSVPLIEFANVTSGALRGHGVLTSSRGASVQVAQSSNVVIDGPIGLNFLARTYEAKDVEIRNWRSFSSVTWGDGIDLFCSENILVDSVFVRSSDDSVAIYNHRDRWYGDSKNITIQNSSLWADVAHPINVGTHGNTENPEVVDGLTIRNVDILDHREKQLLYQGALALNPGDSNLIQNVLVEDLRVENFRLGQLLNFRVMFNDKYNTSPGRGIRNVVIKDLSYEGEGSITSLFSGYDAERTISNVTFHNLRINGKVIDDKMSKPAWYATADFIPLHVNDHVKNLTFTS